MYCQRTTALLCSALLIAIVTRDAFAECRTDSLAKSKPTTIKLNAIERGLKDGPVFYLRSQDADFVMRFKPDDVIAQLREWIDPQKTGLPAYKLPDARAYLEAIERDLPVKDDADLFKYTLRNPGFASLMADLVSDLLDDGKSAIIYWPMYVATAKLGAGLGETTQIEKVSEREQHSLSRLYCDDSGHVVFRSLSINLD